MKKKAGKKKPTMGRPPLPEAERKSHPIVVRLEPGDLSALERKARELGISRTEAIRKAIKRFAGSR